MKLVHSPRIRYPFIHSWAFGKAIHIRPRVRSGRGANEKLKKLAIDHGSKNIGFGLINNFTVQAQETLDHHLRNSSLPKFLEDELRVTTREQCSTHYLPDNSACLAACMELVDACMLDDPAELVPLTDLGIAAEEDPVTLKADDLSHLAQMERVLSFSDRFSFLYEKLIFNTIKIALKEETDEKTYNWLCALAGAITRLQIRFITAAMENLKTMKENSGLSIRDQVELDAMSEIDRLDYKTQYSLSRQRFLLANNHYRVNLRMFNLTSQMLTGLFNLFVAPYHHD